MREMFKLRGTMLLLMAFICLKSNANNCEQFVSLNEYSCQGTFTARSHDEINDYLDGLSPDKKTYKNLYINFEESHKCSEHRKRSKKCKGFSRKGNNRPFSVSSLKITAPCSIIIAKNSKLQLKGDSCLSSNTEIFFGKNSHVVFDSLFINGHRKVQLEENINLIGRTFNSYSNGESSKFTVGKNSKILVNELNVKSKDIISFDKNLILKAFSSIDLEITESSFSGQKIAFSKNSYMKSKKFKIYSLDKVRFRKNTKIISKDLSVYAKECSQEKHVWGLGNKCTSPLPPIVNKVPVANIKCSSTKLKIDCTGDESFDEDGMINKYIFYVNGEVFEQENPGLLIDYESGIYSIELEVVDNNGAISEKVSTSTEVKENLNPVADFECRVTSELGLVCDASSSTDSDDSELNFLWDVGGSLYTGVNQSFSFGYATDVNVTLTVNDLYGGTSSKSITYDIRPINLPPIASLSCETNGPNHLKCEGTNSIDPDGEINYYIFNVNGYQIVNSTGFFESNLFSGNISVSLVVYDRMNLASEESYSSIFVSDNIAPVAYAFCSSDVKFNIKCNATGSYDTDGWIQSYVYNINGVEYSSQDGVLDINVEESGNTTIYLKVYDNLSKESESFYRSIYILPNDPPSVARMTCVTNGAQRLSCNGSQSFDPDDTNESLVFEWSYDDGKVAYGEAVDLLFSYAGEQIVRLKVIDPYGESKSTQQFFYVDPNSPPFAFYTCQSNNPYEISCDASQSRDDDGEIVLYNWYINNQLISTTSSPDFKHVEDGVNFVSVSLEVVDNIGATKSISSNVSLKLPQIYADFNCEQTGNFELSCSPLSTTTDYGEIQKYEWTLPDGSIVNSENVVFSLPQEGSYNISFKAISSKEGVEKTIQKSYELIELPNSEYPSEVKLIANKRVDQFHPLNTIFIFEEINGNIVSDVSLIINEKNIGEDFFTYSSTTIEVSDQSLFKEGQNEIRILFIDNEGKSYDNTWTYFLGSKEVSVSYQNDLGNDKIINIILTESRNHVFSMDLSGDTLVNIPDKDLVAILKESDGRSTISYLSAGKNSLTFNLSGENYLENLNNKDFSYGDEGWSIQRGNHSFTQAYPDRANQIEEGAKLLISPDLEGFVHYSTEFILGNDESKLINTPILFNSSDKRSFYAIRLFNKSTKEESFNIYNINDVSKSGAASLDYHFSHIKGSKGDHVEYEVFAKFFGLQEEQASILRHLISKAKASSGENNISNASNVESNIGVTAEYLLDIIGNDAGDPMANIPTGTFTNFTHRSDLNQRIQMEMKASLEIINPELVDRVEFEICSEVRLDEQGCQKASTIGKEGEYYLVYESGDLDFDSNFLEVYAIVYSKTQEMPIKRKFKAYSRDSGNNTFFRNIIAIDNGRDIKRYSNKRDTGFGGDSWVSKGHLQIFRDLMDSTAVFTITDTKNDNNGKDQGFNILADDFNGVQGYPQNNTLESDLKHKTHNDGVKVDLRWKSFKENDSELERDNTDDIIGFKDAKAIIDLLTNNEMYRYVKEIIITSKTLDNIGKIDKGKYLGADLNDFSKMVSSSCLSNGRLLSEIITSKKNHGNHFDLELTDFVSDRSSLEFLSKAYYNLDELEIAQVESGGTGIHFNLPVDSFKKRVFYYKNEKSCETCRAKPTEYLEPIPFEETAEHPLYFDASSIKHSELYRLENGNDLYQDENSPWLSQFKIKILLFDDSGCGDKITDVKLINIKKEGLLISNENLSFKPRENKLFEVDISETQQIDAFYMTLVHDVENNEHLNAICLKEQGESSAGGVRSVSKAYFESIDRPLYSTICKDATHVIIKNDSDLFLEAELKVNYFKKIHEYTEQDFLNLYFSFTPKNNQYDFNNKLLLVNGEENVDLDINYSPLDHSVEGKMFNLFTINATENKTEVFVPKELHVSNLTTFKLEPEFVVDNKVCTSECSIDDYQCKNNCYSSSFPSALSDYIYYNSTGNGPYLDLNLNPIKYGVPRRFEIDELNCYDAVDIYKINKYAKKLVRYSDGAFFPRENNGIIKQELRNQASTLSKINLECSEL